MHKDIITENQALISKLSKEDIVFLLNLLKLKEDMESETGQSINLKDFIKLIISLEGELYDE